MFWDLYRDDGNENGNYFLGCRVSTAEGNILCRDCSPDSPTNNQ